MRCKKMYRSRMAVKKASKRQPKVPGGIALRPTLWERIDRLAEAQDKSRNQVMEEVLSLHLPVDHDFRKGDNPQDTAPLELAE